MAEHTETFVLYNATCPICSAEIDHYRAYADKNGLDIAFDDLNGPGLSRWGLDADTAARRLYVLHDGHMVSGLEAFRVLWRQMPRYRALAWITGLPGINHLARWGYDRIAAPWLYSKHLKRQQRAADQSPETASR